MDELSNIEARRDVNVANLRRAFAPLDLRSDAAGRACRFADLLERLAVRDGAIARSEPGGGRSPTAA